MKRLYVILPLSLILGTLFMLSCSSSTSEKTTSQPEETPSEASNVAVMEILDGYLKVKDALVQTDGEAASEAAKVLSEKLSTETEGVLGDIHFDIQQIARVTNVETQRVQFESLSENMYSLIKSTSDLGIPVYQQYCPMAFDDKGAAWLATEKEVNNPYFGDLMLHCGSVKEEL